MNNLNIGSKLKKLRLARKLTLQAVAKEVGFSSALISQIENNNVSPPIATLSRIANFFNVKIGVFFAEAEEEIPYEVVHANERKSVPRVITPVGTTNGYSYESLSYRKQNKKMEPFMLTISEKTVEESTYSHDGEEFIYIAKGKVELLMDDQRLQLSEGDSIYFDSSTKHRLLSRDGEEVQILTIIAR